MQTLSPEITLKLMSEFSVPSLASYCVSDRSTADLCADRLFWREKVRSMSHPTLQNDWLITLAELGERRLLGFLLDAIEEQGVVIDQWAVMVAVLNIGNLPELRVLVNDEFLSSVLEDGETLEELRQTLMDQIEKVRDDWKSHGELFNPSFGSYAEEVFVARHLSSFLSSLPSPSVLLTVCLMDPSKEETMRACNNLLLPHLVRNSQIAPLISYRNDLAALKKNHHFASKLYSLELNMGLYGLLDTLRDHVLQYGSLDVVDQVIGDDWDTEDPQFILCIDPAVFKRLAEKSDEPHSFTSGYYSMGPEEWILWMESLDLDEENRNHVITETKNMAAGDGFDHFVRALREYEERR